MCARRTPMAAVLVATLFLLACGSGRSGSAFCAQLGREIPAIGARMTTKREISAMVDRYERLLERAPLSIEDDLRTMTDLLKQAAKVDTNDKDEVQALADATYKSKRAGDKVRAWVKSTCAVDIATGSTIAPPRVATTTTVKGTAATPAP